MAKVGKAYLKLLQLRNFPLESLGIVVFCLDSPAEMALEGITIDQLSVPGAERVFHCLDARILKWRPMTKLESRWMKGDGTAACTSGRALFEKAREGIAQSEVARG